MAREVWKRCLSPNNDVDASSFGRLRDRRSKSVIHYKRRPYAMVFGYTVHSLIAGAFHGPRPAGLVIDHVNGDPSDNRAANLEYVTQGENIRRGAAKRPKKPERELRKPLVFFTTKSQLTQIREAAARDDRSVSAWVRLAIVAELKAEGRL